MLRLASLLLLMVALAVLAYEVSCVMPTSVGH